jgi:pimeloyl-ACP methyl ester carboxylesterase
MTPWVLLRGLARESGHWSDFPAQLSAALGAPVLTLDQPGNGSRFNERSPTRVDAMADDCRTQLTARGLAQPVNIVALSLGAMVATQLASSTPQRVARLVLISTSMRPLAPMHWRLRPAAAAPLLLSLLAADAARLEAAILAATSARADGAAVSRWLALRAAHPVSRRNVLRQLLAAARFRAPAPPPVPTLLLAGRGDRLVDYRCSERIAAAWHCPLALHQWAGHDLPLDDAAWVIDQIRRFGADHPLRATADGKPVGVRA